MFLVPRTGPQRVAVVLAVVVGTMTLAWLAFAAVEKTPSDGLPPRASRILPHASAWLVQRSPERCRLEQEGPSLRRGSHGRSNWVSQRRHAERAGGARSRLPRGRKLDPTPRWDSRLLPRVTGHHVGTTDENIQWAACKLRNS